MRDPSKRLRIALSIHTWYERTKYKHLHPLLPTFFNAYCKYALYSEFICRQSQFRLTSLLTALCQCLKQLRRTRFQRFCPAGHRLNHLPNV